MSLLGKHLLLACLLIGSALSRPTRADVTVDAQQQQAPMAGRGEALPDEFRNVGVTEHPNAQLPMDLSLVDDHGQDVKLGDYFKPNKPVVLQLGYFGCPMLCGLVSHGLIDSAKELKLTAGKDYELVFVSVHPAETPSLAAQKKQSYLDDYSHTDEANGFHFLVGQQRDIRRLTDTVGFNFKMVSSTREIAHPAVLFVCTPDGHVSRYLYGVSFPPRTLRLSLVEAAAGKIGTTIDQILLFCYHFDASSGGYVMGAVNMMRFGGVLTLLAVGSGVFWLTKKEARLAQAVRGSDLNKPSDENMNGSLKK